MTILHVVDIHLQAETGTAAELLKRRWEEGFAKMGQLAGSFYGQVNAQTILEEGLPWETIVAKSRDFDLVILGEANHRQNSKLFCRKTVQRVLEHASCPVMIVRRREQN